MKIIISSIISLIIGASTSYLYVTHTKNKALEDFALMNVLNGVATNDLLKRNDISTIQDINDWNLFNSLSAAMHFDGSQTTKEFNESKTRAYNALYLQWLNQPPSYLDSLKDEKELFDWHTNEHKAQMAFLEKHYLRCKENTELKCKGH